MQILHPFAGPIQRYFDEIADPDRYRPDHCPQCEAKHPLTGHGFYCRTLVDAACCHWDDKGRQATCSCPEGRRNA
jgi:hypothetical protein